MGNSGLPGQQEGLELHAQKCTLLPQVSSPRNTSLKSYLGPKKGEVLLWDRPYRAGKEADRVAVGLY